MNSLVSKIIKPKTFAIVILVIAIAFVVVGMYNKEWISVMGKSTKICFECIGIG